MNIRATNDIVTAKRLKTTDGYVDISTNAPAVNDILVASVAGPTGTATWQAAGTGTTAPFIESTGVKTGGQISIGTPNTTVTITDGTGVVTDPETGIATDVSWSGLTNIPITGIAAQNLTFLMIDSAGALKQQPTKPTNSELRDQINIGTAVHIDRLVINQTQGKQSVIANPTNQIHDVIGALGLINLEGNNISSNGFNLNIDKAEGKILVKGDNYSLNSGDPHRVATGLLSPATFQYRMQDGTNYTGLTQTLLLPDLYDVGSVATAVPNNKWTLQVVSLFSSNVLKIQMGQTLYNSKVEAEQGIGDSFTVETSISENATRIGYIAIKRGCFEANNTAECVFLTVSKFGSVNAGAPIAVTTLQQAYENSTPAAEITTNATNTALTLVGGETNTDYVLTVKDISSVDSAHIRADGEIECVRLVPNPTAVLDVTAVGAFAGGGPVLQEQAATAIGAYAGFSTQKAFATAVGFAAGYIGQGDYAVAIGDNAGYTTQGDLAVCIGVDAGTTSQGEASVAVGRAAGHVSQLAYAVAIGSDAGYQDQGIGSVAVGNLAGFSGQLTNAIAVGYQAAEINQGANAVAIGSQAGRNNQGPGSVAVGYQSDTSGINNVAIGYGSASGGSSSVAIGSASVANGNNAMALGNNAYGVAGNLVLNASGLSIGGGKIDSTYIAPIAAETESNQLVTWNSTTKELATTTHKSESLLGLPRINAKQDWGTPGTAASAGGWGNAYGNGILMLVGDSGSVKTTSDGGYTWNTYTNALPSSRMRGLAFAVIGGTPRWVAAANGSATHSLTFSDDNGATWNACSGYTDINSKFVISMERSGVDKFVAVGNTSFRSEDGITWKAAVSIATAYEQVAYSPELDMILLTHTTGRFSKSEDGGQSWSATFTPTGLYWDTDNAAGWGLAWSPTLGIWAFITGSLMTGTYNALTWDGLSTSGGWNQYTLPSKPISGLNTIVWSNSLGMFAGITAGSGAELWTSFNGKTWNQLTAPVNWCERMSVAEELGTIFYSSRNTTGAKIAAWGY